MDSGAQQAWSPLLVIHGIADLRQSAGGIAALVPELGRRLRENGVDSFLISCALDNQSAPSAAVSLRARVFSTLGALQERRRQGVKVVCHSHGLWRPFNHIFVTAALRFGFELIISPHGMLMPAALDAKWAKKMLAWHLYQRRDMGRASLLHVTSENEFAAVRRRCPTEAVRCVPFGVVDAALVRAYRHAKPEKLLLFLGRLDPIKNLIGLISAFSAAGLRDWRLLIVGPDDLGHGDKLRKHIDFLRVSERVTLCPPRYGAAKSELFSSSDALVLPSFSENFGAVVVEALAHGLPVVVSSGAPWSFLEAEGCGWVTDPDVPSLVQSLKVLGDSDEAQRRLMGARGRAYVLQRWTWERVMPEFLTLYRDAGP